MKKSTSKNYMALKAGGILIVCVLLVFAILSYVIPRRPLAITPSTSTPIVIQPPIMTTSTSPVVIPLLTSVIIPNITPTSPAAFMFVSMGDAQGDPVTFTKTVDQIEVLNPAFSIFNGDLENDGFRITEMTPMITALKNANLFDGTFFVRGNHDAHIFNSDKLWEKYFETPPNVRAFSPGIKDYVSMDTSTDTLTYSFEYENSIFIGLDDPGDVYLITNKELVFLDERLTHAESIGLVHAFIFFHGPMYCVESVHCGCTSKSDSTCTPSSLVSVINKHPIISAFFHGHEHILGWTHMDNTRVASLSGSFEEFLTSPSGGGTYTSHLYPERMDYTYMDMASSQGFGTVTVSGNSFTFSLYKVGNSLPVWTKTFTKNN